MGSLFGLEDGRVYFRFDGAYALDARRPTLSVSFQAETEHNTPAQLPSPSLNATIGKGDDRLPVFFYNVLPEGMLRKLVLINSGVQLQLPLGVCRIYRRCRTRTK